MNAITKLAAVVLFASCAIGQSQSKRTADFLRLSPQTHVDKEVTLDVSMVKPVHWKSPSEELAFFHVLTIDRRDNKHGGWMLVAVPAADSGKFAKKYGTNFDGRSDMDRLTATFILVSGSGPSGFWMLDTTGKVSDMIKDKRFSLPDAAKKDNPDVQGPGKNRALRRF